MLLQMEIEVPSLGRLGVNQQTATADAGTDLDGASNHIP